LAVFEIMLKFKSVCFGCSSRTIDCHATCKDYLNERQFLINTISKKQKEDNLIDGFGIKSKTKAKYGK